MTLETWGVYSGDKLVHRVRTQAAAVRWLRASALDGTGVIAKEGTGQDGHVVIEHEGIYVEGQLVEVHDSRTGIRSYAGTRHNADTG